MREDNTNTELLGEGAHFFLPSASHASKTLSNTYPLLIAVVFIQRILNLCIMSEFPVNTFGGH